VHIDAVSSFEESDPFSPLKVAGFALYGKQRIWEGCCPGFMKFDSTWDEVGTVSVAEVGEAFHLEIQSAKINVFQFCL
jgi:hypothetical protein